MPDISKPPGLPLRALVVLAGGGSRRLGHDKLTVQLAGVTVLDRLLAGLASLVPGVPVTVVGPPRSSPQPVTWVSEDPPGGGPVAGIHRALEEVTDPNWLVGVVAGDQPFAATAIPALLLAAQDGRLDGAIAVDGTNRDQPLLAVYRTGPLRTAIGPEPSGRAVRSVTASLRLGRVRIPEDVMLDIDTEDDVRRARALATPRVGR